jgi:hypothetical protein
LTTEYGGYIPCTVCGDHMADSPECAALDTKDVFPYDKCECCGTLVLYCSPWPAGSDGPRFFWEKCFRDDHQCSGEGHVRVVHTPERCKAARAGDRPRQPVNSEPGRRYDDPIPDLIPERQPEPEPMMPGITRADLYRAAKELSEAPPLSVRYRVRETPEGIVCDPEYVPIWTQGTWGQ